VAHDGRYHLVLEHVQGCDLAAVMKRHAAVGRPFPIPEALEIAIALLRALGHAHALQAEDGRLLGLVHRDVSPHNVLLSQDGEVKLTDFGVAKPTLLGPYEDAPALPVEPPPVATVVLPLSTPGEQRAGSSGLVKGTPGYLAPEQVLGQPVDCRTDLFAVGVILFELLTGRRLFQGHDSAELMRAALSVEVPVIVPFRPACPVLLEEVVRRALSRDPAGRFATAAQMEEALAEVQASLREPFTTRSGPGRGIAALVREVLAARATRTGQTLPPPPASGQANALRAVGQGALLSSLALPSRGSTPPPPDRDRATVRTPRPQNRATPVVARRRKHSWALVVGMALAAAACAAGAAGAARKLREAA
jgi:serine/threonine-protein kinase